MVEKLYYRRIFSFDGLQSESNDCGKDIKKEVRVEVLWLVKVDGWYII